MCTRRFLREMEKLIYWHIYLYASGQPLSSQKSLKTFLSIVRFNRSVWKWGLFSLVTTDLHHCHKSNTASRSPSSAIQYNSNLNLSLHSTVFFFFFQLHLPVQSEDDYCLIHYWKSDMGLICKLLFHSLVDWSLLSLSKIIICQLT